MSNIILAGEISCDSSYFLAKFPQSKQGWFQQVIIVRVNVALNRLLSFKIYIFRSAMRITF